MTSDAFCLNFDWNENFQAHSYRKEQPCYLNCITQNLLHSKNKKEFLIWTHILRKWYINGCVARWIKYYFAGYPSGIARNLARNCRCSICCVRVYINPWNYVQLWALFASKNVISNANRYQSNERLFPSVLTEKNKIWFSAHVNPFLSLDSTRKIIIFWKDFCIRKVSFRFILTICNGSCCCCGCWWCVRENMSLIRTFFALSKMFKLETNHAWYSDTHTREKNPISYA